MRYSAFVLATAILLGSVASGAAQGLLGTVLNAAKQAQQRQQAQQQTPATQPVQQSTEAQPVPTQPNVSQTIGQADAKAAWCSGHQTDPTCAQNYNQAQASRKQRAWDAIKNKWIRISVLYADSGAAWIPGMSDDSNEYFDTGDDCAKSVAGKIREMTAELIPEQAIYKRQSEGVYELYGRHQAINATSYLKYSLWGCVQEQFTKSKEFDDYMSAPMSEARAKAIKLFPTFHEAALGPS